MAKKSKRKKSTELLLVMGEICMIAPNGDEGVAYDQAVIHFAGDAADSEREICITSPGAPRIAEQIVRAVNSYVPMRDKLEKASDASARRSSLRQRQALRFVGRSPRGGRKELSRHSK